jgi:predicted nuclease of predicted toxin-antitoxin system
MRLLLDESVPVGLRDYLTGHQVSTVVQMGWDGSTNGSLLALAATQFDAFITADKNLQYQQNLQNLQNLPIAIVVLSGRSNALPAILPLVSALERALAALAPRSLVVVK